jgi:hypothetical protein
MHDHFKRFTAAGLIAVMLLVGFVAEYTHRHAMPACSPTAFADTGSPQPEKPSGQQFSHICFVCQLNSVAVEIGPEIDLAILNVQPAPVSAGDFVFVASTHFDLSLRRGPPAFLA